jgi:16S rRNA (guanine(1405)-N(7))-methyltransferase
MKNNPNKTNNKMQLSGSYSNTDQLEPSVQLDNQKITSSILYSKKFRNLDSKLIADLVEDYSKKYKPKDVEKEVRNKLHQIWGTYFASIPDYKKLAQKVTNGQIMTKDLLRIHVSTSERVDFIEDFYNQIFKDIKEIKSVLDIGCGFNPLSVEYMKLANGVQYMCLDIDSSELDFLKEVLSSNRNIVFEFLQTSILDYEIKNVDVIFMLKLLQNIEQQKKNKGIEVFIDAMNKAKYVVVSFPTKSVTGKSKGMENSYSTWFEKVLSENSIKSSMLNFKNEIVYICQK